jgi:hypothetical protein
VLRSIDVRKSKGSCKWVRSELGYYQLASVLFRQVGDLVKGEMLARKAHRIRIHCYGNDHQEVGLSGNLLANILTEQGNLGDETERLAERFLAISIRNEGRNGLHTASGNQNLFIHHTYLSNRLPINDEKREHLLKAKSYCTEGVRIYTEIYGSTHPVTIELASMLPVVTLMIAKCNRQLG